MHGLTRPALRRLGRPGDYLSGVVILHGYLGALMLASPWVFERSAIPRTASEAGMWIGLSTVVGLAAAHLLFSGPDGLDRIREQRSQPRVQQLVQENGTRTVDPLAA